MAAWPRQAWDVAGSDRIGNDNEYNRHNAGHLQQRPHSRAAISEDDLRRKRNHFRCLFEGGCNACTKTDVELNIATFDPTQADNGQTSRHVRFVPIATERTAIK